MENVFATVCVSTLQGSSNSVDSKLSIEIAYMLQNRLLQGTVVQVSDVASRPLVIKHGIMR